MAEDWRDGSEFSFLHPPAWFFGLTVLICTPVLLMIVAIRALSGSSDGKVVAPEIVGTYVNPCCNALTIYKMDVGVGAERVPYRIENMSHGPAVLPSRHISVSNGARLVVDAERPTFLFFDDQAQPKFIKIESSDGRVIYQFERQPEH